MVRVWIRARGLWLGLELGAPPPCGAPALTRHVLLRGLHQAARVDGRAVDEVEDREVLELAAPRVGHGGSHLGLGLGLGSALRLVLRPVLTLTGHVG